MESEVNITSNQSPDIVDFADAVGMVTISLQQDHDEQDELMMM